MILVAIALQTVRNLMKVLTIKDGEKDIWVPDSYKAGIIALDNDPAERRYQPACRDCYKVSDAPETAFKLPDYKKPA